MRSAHPPTLPPYAGSFRGAEGRRSPSPRAHPREAKPCAHRTAGIRCPHGGAASQPRRPRARPRFRRRAAPRPPQPAGPPRVAQVRAAACTGSRLIPQPPATNEALTGPPSPTATRQRAHPHTIAHAIPCTQRPRSTGPTPAMQTPPCTGAPSVSSSRTRSVDATTRGSPRLPLRSSLSRARPAAAAGVDTRTHTRAGGCAARAGHAALAADRCHAPLRALAPRPAAAPAAPPAPDGGPAGRRDPPARRGWSRLRCTQRSPAGFSRRDLTDGPSAPDVLSSTRLRRLRHRPPRWEP